MKFEWKCPKCRAPANGCGIDSLKVDHHHPGECSGFICECDRGYDMPTHGLTVADPCTEATCYHCGWRGTHPVAPKGMRAWEKKALAAGWTMPKTRELELEDVKR